MSKTITIPTDRGRPFVVIHNGITHIYEPGETVEVPDGIALEIEECERWDDKYLPEIDAPGSGGTGGGAEVRTCNVRVVPAQTGVDGFVFAGEWYGCCYTKYENGTISSVFINSSNSMELVGCEVGTEYDFTLENVMCGSTLYISTPNTIYIPDDETAYGAKYDDSEGQCISAPTEPNVTLIVKLANEDGGW